MVTFSAEPPEHPHCARHTACKGIQAIFNHKTAHEVTHFYTTDKKTRGCRPYTAAGSTVTKHDAVNLITLHFSFMTTIFTGWPNLGSLEHIPFKTANCN